MRDFAFQSTDAQDQLFLALADRRDVGTNCAQKLEDKVGAFVVDLTNSAPKLVAVTIKLPFSHCTLICTRGAARKT